MKYILSVFCSVSLLVISVVTASAAQPFGGDVNDGGLINMIDAYTVYRYAASGTTPEDLVTVADVNQNGKVNILDAFMLYHMGYSG